MHMVFYNMKYDNAKAAIRSKSRSALLVLAVLFKKTAKKSPRFDFTSKIRGITHFGESTTHDFGGMAFTKLLPDNIEKYYTYQGSLTTPPCSAITTWVVFDATARISNRQMMLFPRIRNKRKKRVRFNWREVQPIFDRKIYVSTPNKS